jgi:ABC-type multidrug transport system ATPase subunit
VDVATEALIQHALDRLMQGRTSFVIAQRISTVLNADQILVLEKGRIAAVGRHEELMEESPVYAEIYRSQLVEDAAPASETPFLDTLTTRTDGADSAVGAGNGAAAASGAGQARNEEVRA